MRYLVLALVLAGCGSGDSIPPDLPDASPEVVAVCNSYCSFKVACYNSRREFCERDCPGIVDECSPADLGDLGYYTRCCGDPDAEDCFAGSCEQGDGCRAIVRRLSGDVLTCPWLF